MNLMSTSLSTLQGILQNLSSIWTTSASRVIAHESAKDRLEFWRRSLNILTLCLAVLTAASGAASQITNFEKPILLIGVILASITAALKTGEQFCRPETVQKHEACSADYDNFKHKVNAIGGEIGDFLNSEQSLDIEELNKKVENIKDALRKIRLEGPSISPKKFVPQVKEELDRTTITHSLNEVELRLSALTSNNQEVNLPVISIENMNAYREKALPENAGGIVPKAHRS